MEYNNRILFEKPVLSDLAAKYCVVDMHFHSRFSDGSNYVRSIAKRARRFRIGLAITDHNEITGAVRLARYKEILTIPGIEITSKEGAHLLVYFYEIRDLIRFFESKIKPYQGKNVMKSIALPMEDIIGWARDYASMVILAHPYCAAYTGLCNPVFSERRRKLIFEMVDGVEAINAENLSRWNLKSTVLGFNMGKAMTGGSDGHNLFEMGKAVTFTEKVRDRGEFLDAVKSKENKVVGKETDFLGKLTTNGNKIRHNIKNYPHIMGKNLRYSYTIINSKNRVKTARQGHREF